MAGNSWKQLEIADNVMTLQENGLKGKVMAGNN